VLDNLSQPPLETRPQTGRKLKSRIGVDLKQLTLEIRTYVAGLAHDRRRRDDDRVFPFSVARSSFHPAHKLFAINLHRRKTEFLRRTTKRIHIHVFVDDGLADERDGELIRLKEGVANLIEKPALPRAVEIGQHLIGEFRGIEQTR